MKMTNLDQLKAKMANMNSEEFYKTVVDLYFNPKYCVFSSSDGKCGCGANIECDKCDEGAKVWLDLELEGCSECLCNKCSINGENRCLQCINCLKKDERDVVRECDYY